MQFLLTRPRFMQGEIRMRKIICSIGIILAVMFLLPLAVSKFAPANAGMALCFILFFAINPIFSVLVGIYSGLDIKKMWCIPFVLALVFLLSSWLLFDMGEPTFIIYSGVYLIISIITVLITLAIKHCIYNKK